MYVIENIKIFCWKVGKQNLKQLNKEIESNCLKLIKKEIISMTFK